MFSRKTFRNYPETYFSIRVLLFVCFVPSSGLLGVV
jgi:hypothetical protein